MYQCDYCHAQIQTTGVCPHCGTTQYTADGKIIYGATANDVSRCEMVITEKYLIIRRVSNAEARGATVGRAFGLVGILAADLISQKSRPHGFYALSDFRKGIFPYLNKGIKKKNAIKLITNDGRDFILIFDKPGVFDGTKKVIKKMVERIGAAIPSVEDGSGMNYGNVYCENPYVTFETFDNVKPGYSAPPRPSAYNASAGNNSFTGNTSAAAQQQHSRPQPTPQQTAQTTTEQAKVRCPQCGALVPAASKFCSRCGCKIVRIKKCLRCGSVLADDDKFCSECGYQIK